MGHTKVLLSAFHVLLIAYRSQLSYFSVRIKLLCRSNSAFRFTFRARGQWHSRTTLSQSSTTLGVPGGYILLHLCSPTFSMQSCQVPLLPSTTFIAKRPSSVCQCRSVQYHSLSGPCHASH